MQVDMAAVGQPGVVFDLTGTGDSMFVLDGTGWLNVSEVDRTQSVDYMGYRSDLNQYFLVNMSPDRTALSYMAGDFVSNDVMKLTDPMSQVTAEMAIGKKGTKTTVRRTAEPCDLHVHGKHALGSKDRRCVEDLDVGTHQARQRQSQGGQPRPCRQLQSRAPPPAEILG